MTPSEAVIAFNQGINARSLEGIRHLMHPDYTFIDSAGTVEDGRDAGLRSWQSFFDQFSDYRNVFTSIVQHEEVVSVLGYSECSFVPLAGPALWSARVTDGLIREWRVWDDTPENRRLLGLTDAGV